MDDQQVAQSNRGKTSKREQRARAGKFRRWLCHAPTPSLADDHQKPSGSQNQNAIGVKSRKARKKKTCSSGCCNGCWCACKTGSSCWCACKTISRTDAEKTDEALEHPAGRKDAVTTAERLPPHARRRDATVAVERLPPGPARELPIPGYVVGQDVYLKTALSYLVDDAVDIVGIYGPRGVGKTTLLRSINNQFCSSAGRTEFELVMFVVVGKNPVMCRLQRRIAYEAGLLLEDGENEVSQAASIFNFLKGKSYLLLLDDIWEPLQLSEIGIPQPFSDSSIRRKQKLFLTTPLVDISGRTQAHKIIILESLKWEESWNLFKLTVGEDVVSDQGIRGLAMALAKECGGLPLALVIMGLAMRTKKKPDDWQNMITLIKSLNFHDISGMEDELLPLLHACYVNLQDSRTRDCFLYYSLWPEGYRVLKENAIKFWMGLGSIGQFESVLQAYDVGYCIIESLKAASLLQSSEQNYRRLEMPKVIREMALWIASQQGGKKTKWLVQAANGQTRPEDWSRAETVALMYVQIMALPDSCYCPHLQTLILRGNKRLVKFPNVLLPCMPALKYLDLSHTGIDHLPAEVGILVNLQFLNLSFTKISSLPEEMHELVELKHLELEGATELKKIPHGMIASLEKLQVLNFYMSGYANWNWLSLRRHDGITFEELISLPQLRYVGFTVRNIPSLLRLFSMRISVHSLAIRELRGLISLHLLPALLSRSKMGSLKNLTIESTRELKELVLGETNGAPTWSLSKLEVFNLVCLPELEKVIWRGVRPHACLPNLRFLSLFYCNGIKNIAWVVHLPCLEELYVQNCNELVRFISKEASRDCSLRIEEPPMTSFPMLKYIFLQDLKKLVSISDHVLPFPSLERILVYNCVELKRLPFGLKSAEKMRMIHGERNWWENVAWEDQSARSIFLPCFREIPAECEPTMKVMHGL